MSDFAPQPTPGDQLTALSEKIENIKKELTEKCDTLQKQITELKNSVGTLDSNCNSRLGRITTLIGSTLDHIQLIVHTVAGMNQRMLECEDKIGKHGTSLAVNKRNLLELNKYVKKVDAMWKAAQKEVDALNEESHAHRKFRYGVIAAISSVCGTVSYFGWDLLKSIWKTLFE